MEKAINSAKMKEDNRRLLLDIIRRGPISRCELAEQASLTRAAVTLIVDQLLKDGLLTEQPAGTGGVGRHPVLLSLRPDARFCYALKLTRGGIRAGIVSLDGREVASRVLSQSGTPQGILRKAAAALNELAVQKGISKAEIFGMGVITPGPVQKEDGTVCAPQFDKWHNVPLVQLLQEATGLPVRLERDSNALALEEKFYGENAALSDFCVIVSDAGIGSGLILHNRLFRGAAGRAGEIGHISICYNGPECSCGGRGCFERYADTEELLKDSRYSSWAEICAHRESDRDAQRLFDREASYFAAAVITAANLFDLERVVLLGEIALPDGAFAQAVDKLVQERVLVRTGRPFCVSSSRLTCSVRTAAMPAIARFFGED